MARILVVDDEPVALRLVSRILEKEGYEVVTEGDGQDALARLQADGNFDVVVTDVKMPRVDGRDLALAVRAWPERKHIPVILMSGAVGPRFIMDLLKDGVSAFIPKPVSSDSLLEYVGRYLECPPHTVKTNRTNGDSDEESPRR